MTSIFDIEKFQEFPWRTGTSVLNRSRWRVIVFGALAITLMMCLSISKNEYASRLTTRLSSHLGMSSSTATQAIIVPQAPKLLTYAELKPNKVAVIIESRPLVTLFPLLVHYAGVLGPSWPVVLFTNDRKVIDDVDHRFWLSERNIYVVPLPQDLNFTTHYDVSEWLASPWLWEQLAPAEHVFMFQSDSIICANARQKVDDYLKYDLIGAPIPELHGFGYNGGFSLRNRTLVLDIIEHNPFAKDSNRSSEATNRNQFEDQWFFLKMEKVGARLPEPWVAATFAVQQIWFDKPLGYHQVWTFLEDDMPQIREWCPEIDLATDDLLACEPPTC